MKDGVEDDAVTAVASNNWVAERLASEGDAAPKKLAAELLKKFEGFFEKVNSVLKRFHFFCCLMDGKPCSGSGDHRRFTDFLVVQCTQGRELRMKATLERRLSQAQKEVMYANYALLLMLAGRNDAARECTTFLQTWCVLWQRKANII